MRYLFIFICLFSCNFKPLYQNFDYRNKIYINPIPSIEGAELYDQLSQLLGHVTYENAEYILDIKLHYEELPLIIHKSSSDVLRELLISKVEIKLLNKNLSNVLYKKELRNITSYNAFPTPYSYHIEQGYVKFNAAKQLAQDIYYELLLLKIDYDKKY